jgi:hypothetical protein
MLQTNEAYARMGLRFERKIAAALVPFAPEAQVPAGGGFADFVINKPRRAVVEVKRTLRREALAQARYYAAALGIGCIVLVGMRLAAPPEAFGATEVLVDFAEIRDGVNVILWANR